MSATNAISGISLIGSLVVTGADYSPLSTILGTIAVACSSTNLVGGFLITDRMLKMFKRKGDQVDRARQRLAAGPILWGAVTVAVAVLLILAGAGRLDPGAAGRAHGGVSHQALSFLYIVSALLFILGLKGLSSPRWARKGMFAAELGMLMAIVGTLFHHEIVSYRWIAVGIAAGSIVGATMGLRIPMTAVPQRTALSHSLGALAATLVGISEYIRQGSALGAVTMTAIGFEVIIGALTFTGSLMAAAKLQELLRGAPITYRGQNRSNMALLLAMGPVRTIVPDEVPGLLDGARSVIIVPGYGMAVAQAQHGVAELGKLLVKRGIDVKYAIHPVAGRMPGHMNVLLAEANVPYDQLFEMEQINPYFGEADLALVIGANDVTNPAARKDRNSPLYGMPILEVDRAKSVIVLKRSMRPGFAGVDNDLYYNENCMMLFGDARESLTRLFTALK